MNDKYQTYTTWDGEYVTYGRSWGNNYYYNICGKNDIHEFLHKVISGVEEPITLIKKEIPKFDF